MTDRHVEFELEWAGRDPKERPDWPLPSFDARDWAEAFCKLNPGSDESLMISWFANALMAGYDRGRADRADQDVASLPRNEGPDCRHECRRVQPAIGEEKS